MESCSFQSSTLTTIPSSLTKIGTSTLHGQVLKFHSSNKSPLARKLKCFAIRAKSSGAVKVSSGSVEAIPKEADAKDDNLAFVAGATGRVGSRTVRELLKLGFRVRAGVRSSQRAQALVQSVKQLKLDVEGVQPIEMLEIVECDLEKPSQIRPALGNASIVICCIGASEKEVFDVTGPYRIDYQAAKNLVDAATAAKVDHFIMVSSLGTNKIGFPAAILNLFWGVLVWKRKAEEALIASRIPYSIVRPGGMERPTDAYKETHNVTLSEEDTLFGGQVSNLQVAELMAFMAKNQGLSYCKVVEVIAETTAPSTPFSELLEKIPFKRTPPKDYGAAVDPRPTFSEPVPSKVASTIPETETTMEKVLAKTSLLSPYTAYEYLKPPSSPSPTPSGPVKVSSDSAPAAESPSPETVRNGAASAASETPQSAYRLSFMSSCYLKIWLHHHSYTTRNSPSLLMSTRYDDLKPPTSLTPTVPAGSLKTSPTTSEEPKTGNNKPPSTSSTELQHQIGPKPSPLSPYTMYEDMKPPTSPSPSTPRN